MNPVFEVISLITCGVFTLSGVMTMLAAFEAIEIDDQIKCITNWPAMLIGFALALIGVVGFMLMRGGLFD